MQVTVYLRVARGLSGKPTVAASVKPNWTPLMSNKGNRDKKALPTAAFALKLDVPNEVMRQAEQVVADINLPAGQAQVCAAVTDTETPQ